MGFDWVTLLSCRPDEGEGSTVHLAEHFLLMLLAERLRTPADRLAVSELMRFRGFSLPEVIKPSSRITPDALQVGSASLPRLEQGALPICE